MIRINNVDIHGWEAAIRGMRNPKNSWDKSDSTFDYSKVSNEEGTYCRSNSRIGENDYKLMKNLANAGPDHGKFLRMITVTMDIYAPLYWWKEADTYKVGTVANSCSTMHKIHAKPFRHADFSHENLTTEGLLVLDAIIDHLNHSRELFLATNDSEYWWDMIQILPSSYNQLRTVQLNYQVLKNMFHARKNHKLDEWREFCDFIRDLPYSELITGE